MRSRAGRRPQRNARTRLCAAYEYRCFRMLPGGLDERCPTRGPPRWVESTYTYLLRKVSPTVTDAGGAARVGRPGTGCLPVDLCWQKLRKTTNSIGFGIRNRPIRRPDRV